MKDILISFIKHKNQRINDVGDYQTVKFLDSIRISKLEDPDYSFLVAIHEMIELYLVKKAKIPISKIDKWDMGYKGTYNEPGSDPDAPYHAQHKIATSIEKILAKYMDVNWRKYGDAIDKLTEGDILCR